MAKKLATPTMLSAVDTAHLGGVSRAVDGDVRSDSEEGDSSTDYDYDSEATLDIDDSPLGMKGEPLRRMSAEYGVVLLRPCGCACGRDKADSSGEEADAEDDEDDDESTYASIRDEEDLEGSQELEVYDDMAFEPDDLDVKTPRADRTGFFTHLREGGEAAHSSPET